MIYVDTSLLLPVYVLEAGSEQANRILEAASPILISDLTVAELHVGLARKVRLGELSVYVLAGVWLGLYVRFNYLQPNRVHVNDPFLALGSIIAVTSAMLVALAFVRNRTS